MRDKTHIEAVDDGTIDSISIDKLHKLVGWKEPYGKKDKWEITCADDGMSYDADSEFEGELIASLEQIKLLQLKILKKMK